MGVGINNAEEAGVSRMLALPKAQVKLDGQQPGDQCDEI
jgi:hypothetical protein